MRKLITTLAMTGVLGLGAITSSVAAPVAGYEGLYATMIASCSLPVGTVATCEAAITAYSGALVAADVGIDVANESFTAARSAVFATNDPNEEFQVAIDALFELLLPDSGAVGPAAAPGDAPAANGGSGGPVPASAT